MLNILISQMQFSKDYRISKEYMVDMKVKEIQKQD